MRVGAGTVTYSDIKVTIITELGRGHTQSLSGLGHTFITLQPEHNPAKCAVNSAGRDCVAAGEGYHPR